MPPDRGESQIGLVLSAFILVIAAALAYRQWTERRRRSPDLSWADARHFAWQDARRALGVLVMGLLAAGLAVGTRLPMPAAGRVRSSPFVQVWLGVFLLILALLMLAFLDWLATRQYAGRHRRAIRRERDETLREVFRDRVRPRLGPGPRDGRRGEGLSPPDLPD